MGFTPLGALCQIVAEAGTAKDRRAASRIYPIRKRGNLLLCTLLLGNVSVNALLSILMADLTNGGWAGGQVEGVFGARPPRDVSLTSTFLFDVAL